VKTPFSAISEIEKNFKLHYLIKVAIFGLHMKKHKFIFFSGMQVGFLHMLKISNGF
jgi:hypothetical protein